MGKDLERNLLAFLMRLRYLLMVELKQFFTKLSVRPGNLPDISTHLFPSSTQDLIIKNCSALEIGEFVTLGFTKFTHRSLHYLGVLELCPFRLLKTELILTQDLVAPKKTPVHS